MWSRNWKCENATGRPSRGPFRPWAPQAESAESETCVEHPLRCYVMLCHMRSAAVDVSMLLQLATCLRSSSILMVCHQHPIHSSISKNHLKSRQDPLWHESNASKLYFVCQEGMTFRWSLAESPSTSLSDLTSWKLHRSVHGNTWKHNLESLPCFESWTSLIFHICGACMTTHEFRVRFSMWLPSPS